MLGIYAHTFMTATRTGCVELRDVAPTAPRRKRWLGLRKSRCIDLDKL